MRGSWPRNRASSRTRWPPTELVLAREQHLSQLDGLAAAAGARARHTTLHHHGDRDRARARAIEPDSPLYGTNISLLREQAQRCRAILAKLTELSSNVEPFDRMPLSALIDEAVAPHRNFGVAINVSLAARNDATEPVGGRNPGILYGLGNLVGECG